MTKTGIAVLFAFGLWVSALSGGFYCLMDYEATPGETASNPSELRADSIALPLPGHFTLIMAAHPRCPCTRASIEELRRVMELNSAPIRAQVLFFRPGKTEWTPTDLWSQAAAIPQVHAGWDDDGIEAARLGLCTSGHVVLYSPQGKLLFSGGITNGRGNLGPSKGNQALASWLTAGKTGETDTLVFGCSLTDPHSSCTNGVTKCQ